MGIEEILDNKRMKEARASNELFSGIRQRISKYKQMKRYGADDMDSSGLYRIGFYSGLAAVGGILLVAEVAAKNGEYLINLITNFSPIKTLPLKAKIAGVAATAALAAGTYMGIDSMLRNDDKQPMVLESRVTDRDTNYARVIDPSVITYTLTENDIRKGDILYGILESKFGYSMRDQSGKYVPLRTTTHHVGNPETFLDAFRQLNPELYAELVRRERRARRPRDQSFQHLRPGDEIKFYSAK